MTLETIEQIAARSDEGSPGSRAFPDKAVVLAFAGVLSVFVGLQFAIWHINGLWLDEIYSLVASDPANSLRDDFVWRMAPDTMPPGYYCLLYFARLFVKNGHIAAIVLNCAIFALAAIVVVLSARRSRLIPCGLLCISAFMLSGPVIYYAQEARPYLAGLALTLVVSWYASLRLTQQDAPPFAFGFTALGILAALIHLYAALYCCCIAAGMLAVALKYPGRRFLLREGAVLGLSAGFISCLWLLAVRNSFDRVEWLHSFFNVHWLLSAFGLVFVLNGGPVVIAILIALAAYAPKNRAVQDIERRSLSLAFSIAYFLFFAVPILISFKQPVIMGRYWLIGSPGLIVFVIFQLKALYPGLIGNHALNESVRVRSIFAALAVLWLLISLGGVYLRFGDKTIWRGLGDVEPFIANCPAQSVHIGMGLVKKDKFYFADRRQVGLNAVELFAAFADVSPNIFVPIAGSDGPLLTARDAKCPVLGWAEDLDASSLQNIPQSDLPRLLRIQASNDEIDIRRHKFGYVVLLRR